MEKSKGQEKLTLCRNINNLLDGPHFILWILLLRDKDIAVGEVL